MGRRATPTPPPLLPLPSSPTLPPQSLTPQSRYFLRNSTQTPEPVIKKESSPSSSPPSPQCHDPLSKLIPHRTNDQFRHPTGVSVQETDSGMYARLGAFASNQTRHHYDIDDSPAYDWSSTSVLDDDGDTFSDEDAMVAFLERQELELPSESTFRPSGEKSLWPVQKMQPRTNNIPLMSKKRGPHSEQLPMLGNESEPDNIKTVSKMNKSRQARKTDSAKRRHRGSSSKHSRSSPLEWIGPITLIGFICFAALFVLTLLTSARRDSYQAYTLHDNVTRVDKAPPLALRREWTWAWMTRPRVKDDDLPTLQYVQDLEHKLEQVQEILQRIEGANRRQAALDRQDASPSRTRIFSALETKTISDMIEEALGADIIAKPDFALYSAGGRVLFDLTSDSLVRSQKSKSFPGCLRAQLLVSPMRPERALQPSVLAGECWAFQGDQGQLGIRLARKIIVTDVTIEHVDHRVAMDIGSAPRRVEIWRLEDPDDRKTIPPQSSGFEMHPPRSSRQGSKETDERQLLSPIKGCWRNSNAPLPVPGASLLASFEYQIKTDDGGRVKRVQTFAIPEEKQDEASTRIVVRIRSNWGHDEHTCLYRVRVHGLEQ